MTQQARSHVLVILLTACVVVSAPAWGSPDQGSAPASATPGGTCQTCHLQLDEPALKDPAVGFEHDVHDRPGLGCVACHGGDPTADDPDESMSPKHGFKGAPKPGEIPKLCGTCHADEEVIRKFAPNLPTDQLSQYLTSVHGKLNRKGDTKVATCISCHGVHGIYAASDPRSSVYPTRVVDTCAKCHADAKLMAPYGISTDQVAKYKKSFHFEALTVQNDLSAPTCNDCHGSHGATPPGVSSISNVCGTCHPQNMDLFQKSPHSKVFADQGMGACEACHGHHDIPKPSDGLVGLKEGAACVQCHDSGDPGGEAAIAISTSLELATDTESRAAQEVAEAQRKGMLMEDADIELQTAHEEIIKARLEVHQASLGPVNEHTSKSVTAAKKSLALAAEARHEIHVRRTGLSIAFVFIVFAIILLILKIRS